MTDGLNDWRSDGEGVGGLYRRHARWLRGRLARSFGVELAEDVVQEAWLRACRYAATGRIRHPRALLLRIATNFALDELRRAAARAPGDKPEAVGLSVYTSTQEESVLLRQVVLSLPQHLRDVFVLSRFAGLSYDQIAERLGISVKTVEWRMSRALAHCTARLRL